MSQATRRDASLGRGEAEGSEARQRGKGRGEAEQGEAPRAVHAVARSRDIEAMQVGVSAHFTSESKLRPYFMNYFTDRYLRMRTMVGAQAKKNGAQAKKKTRSC